MTGPHIAIVGGGITGLATAHYLETRSRTRGIATRITLIESDRRLGGKVGSDSTNGYLLETGPDSFLAQKPWALELIRDLGMSDEVIRPLERRFFMLIGDRLHAVPHELVSLVPTRPEALWKATFLSLWGKSRASVEGLIPARRNLTDESLASFMRRRFGKEFALRFAEPLMGGVHAGHPERMSMPSIYPTYWGMEQKHGSVSRAILALRAASRNRAGAAQSPFVALRHGMQSLVDRVHRSLDSTRVLTGIEVRELQVLPAQDPRPLASHPPVSLRLSDGETIQADAVVLAIPAFNAAPLVAMHVSVAAQRMREISYASTAVASLAYRRDQVGNPLAGTGFLVPRNRSLSITGCTWSSQKWEGRAPEGTVLMRAFMGHAGADGLVREKAENDLAALAHEALSRLLDISGEPVMARVYRWLDAMPQYEVGHGQRIAEMETDLRNVPSVIVTGSAYGGVGIPDCVRQGKQAAETVLFRTANVPPDA